MKIGIGVSLNANAREAPLEAVGEARQAASEPTLAVVFGSIHLQQDQVVVYECEPQGSFLAASPNYSPAPS